MVRFSDEDGHLRCTFDGTMNTVACEEIEKTFLATIQEAGLPVILDMRNVDFIASSFFRLCMKVVKARGADGLAIVNVSAACRRMFKIAGLDRVLGLEPPPEARGTRQQADGI